MMMHEKHQICHGDVPDRHLPILEKPALNDLPIGVFFFVGHAKK